MPNFIRMHRMNSHCLITAEIAEISILLNFENYSIPIEKISEAVRCGLLSITIFEMIFRRKKSIYL